MAKYTLPELPYGYSALEPHISGRMLELHHAVHHAAYVAKSNLATEEIESATAAGDYARLTRSARSLAFNLSGHVLHSMFWASWTPGGGGEPRGSAG